jgi:hypothetical protein
VLLTPRVPAAAPPIAPARGLRLQMRRLTDAERRKRFLDTAREAEASDDPKDFHRTFDKVISKKPKESRE